MRMLHPSLPTLALIGNGALFRHPKVRAVSGLQNRGKRGGLPGRGRGLAGAFAARMGTPGAAHPEDHWKETEASEPEEEAMTLVMRSTFIGLAMVLVLAASAEAGRCSKRSLAGEWGFTETGTVLPPSASTPIEVVAVGRYDFGTDGTFKGKQHASVAGTVAVHVKLGTYVVYSDCTGSLTVQVYDASGTTLLRNSVWAFVLEDNATELRGMLIWTALPNGVPLAPMMTMSSQRLAPPDNE